MSVLDQEVLQVLGSQGGTNPGTQLETVERLGDIVDPTQVQPLNLVVRVDRVGQEEDRSHTQPAKRERVCLSSGVAGQRSSSMILNVRMAARRSRALDFSSLAISAGRPR
jgi:hypothetical protein